MFKFTIRELLLLTVIAGLAVGWWLDRSRLEEKAARAVAVTKMLMVRWDAWAPEWRIAFRDIYPNDPYPTYP